MKYLKNEVLKPLFFGREFWSDFSGGRKNREREFRASVTRARVARPHRVV